PRTDAKGDLIKYETASNGRMCIDVPASVLPYLRDPDAPLWITEGCKKVDSALSHGISCVVGLLGVDGWSSGGMALPDWKEIALRDRDVVIAFDSDVMANRKVRAALERFHRYLDMHGARVRYLVMPALPDSSKCGLDDWFASGKNVPDLEACILDTLPGSVMEWEAPIPFAPETGPPLPLEALPAVMRDLAEAIADQLQAPPDLVFGIQMACISVAIAGKCVIRYEPTGWSENPNTYTLPVAGPASNKSAIFKKTTHVVTEWEAEKSAEATARRAEWESKERALQKRLTAAENAEGRPGKDGKITNPEALRVNALNDLEKHRQNKPLIPDLYGDDATSEAIKERMAEHGGAYGSLSAESALLAILGKGRYSHGEPNFDVILNGHPGDSVKISRVGKPTIIIPAAYLTLGLMVQPEVIRQLGEASGVITRGIAARLLPLFPIDTVGTRDPDPRAPIPEHVTDAWNRALRRLLGMPRPPKPGTLALSHEAETLFTAYRGWLEPRIPAEGDGMRGWLGKLAGTVLRIAAQCHMVQHPEPLALPVSEATMRNAITIGGYFHEHARIMFRMMNGRQGQNEAQQVLEVIRDLGSPTTKREVHRKLQDRAAFQRASDLNEPLARLEERGWIRTEREGKSLAIFLNPYETPDNTDNSHAETDVDTSLSVLSGFSRDVRKPEPTPIREEPLPPTGTEEWSIEI
ncbi:MAG: DUF3987 domain-containing protein, partial [Thermomicrobiales bacterium]